MPTYRFDYEPHELVGKDELLEATAAMADDDDRVERKEFQRDTIDTDFTSPTSSQDSDYSYTTTRWQESSPSSSQESNASQGSSTATDATVAEAEDTSDTDTVMGIGDEASFPLDKLDGAVLRRIAQARQKFYKEGDVTARFIAVVQLLLGLEPAEAEAVYHFVIQRRDTREEPERLTEEDEGKLLGTLQEEWDGLLRKVAG